MGIDLRAGRGVCGVGAAEGEGQEGFGEKAGKARPLDHPSANSGTRDSPRCNQVSQGFEGASGYQLQDQVAGGYGRG